MFSKKKQPLIKSLIADGTEITGDMAFRDGLRIDGIVRGHVCAAAEFPSMLVISETATITGSVVADHIVINGRITGPVHARQMLELQPKARIEGDVTYAALEMHQGALITGLLSPSLAEETKPTLKLAANNP